MSGKKTALIIIGILAGIMAVCTLLAIFVGVPVLKNLKYTNAQKNAEAGQYIYAIYELEGRNMDDYKDVKLKKQEYALCAAKQFISEKDYVNAEAYLTLAIVINADKDITAEANKLLKEVNKKLNM